MHGKEYHWFVRYVLAILDATIYPANAASLKSAMTTMNTVLNLSQNNIGHVMLPVIQSNTTSQALVKHARIIEDSFIGSGFDTTGKVALHLQKRLDAAVRMTSVVDFRLAWHFQVARIVHGSLQWLLVL